jgi:hypothetical protein
VDLHPLRFVSSSLSGMAGGEQVGSANPYGIGGQQRAALWHGTAASFVDLTPSYATAATLLATNGHQEVGYAIGLDGLEHATLWTGTASRGASVFSGSR